jgi:hypothetical protein
MEARSTRKETEALFKAGFTNPKFFKTHRKQHIFPSSRGMTGDSHVPKVVHSRAEHSLVDVSGIDNAGSR